MAKKDMLKYVILLHVTMIMANILLITLQPMARGIVGILLMIACCLLMYNEGAGIGERACSISTSIQNTDKPVDRSIKNEGYSRSRTLRNVLICGMVPFAISVVYICMYFVTLNTQGFIYGQDTLELQEEAQQAEFEVVLPDNGAALEEALEKQEAEAAEKAAEAAEAAGEAAEEEAAAEVDPLELATVYLDENGEVVLDPGQEIEPLSTLDSIVFALRVITCILGLPFWSAVAMLQSQYVLLTPLSVCVLLIYPFIWPFCMYLGYLRGPGLWKATEEAMAKGKRRAKARSRIVKKNKAPKEQKPMI